MFHLDILVNASSRNLWHVTPYLNLYISENSLINIQTVADCEKFEDYLIIFCATKKIEQIKIWIYANEH